MALARICANWLGESFDVDCDASTSGSKTPSRILMKFNLSDIFKNFLPDTQNRSKAIICKSVGIGIKSGL